MEMYIKIVGDTSKYQGKLERVGSHLIKVSGLPQSTQGFRIYLGNDTLIGDYAKFVYPYLDPNLGEGVYEYSDNNMVYEDEQNKPTAEEAERKKIESIIEDYIGNDIRLLSYQLDEQSELLMSVYELLEQIQDILLGSGEKVETETEVADAEAEAEKD